MSKAAARGILQALQEALNWTVGTEKLDGFRWRELCSQILRRRTAAEIESYLAVGTARTTPPLAELDTSWPKPWLFTRFLIFLGLIYARFAFGLVRFHNEALVPGLILVGTFAVPVATLILFFEFNIPRNVSLYRLAILFSLGSLVSTLFSLIGYDISGLGWFGPCSAGLIEESAKLAALFIIAYGWQHKFMLNGMLFGAAVGAGFGAFESAGFALHLLAREGVHSMFQDILFRGLLAPLMHVVWTAMVGAALWRAKHHRPTLLTTLTEPRFCRVLLLAMLLHALWNLPCQEPPFQPKEFLLGATAWFAILGLVQQGLHEVRLKQRSLTAAL